MASYILSSIGSKNFLDAKILSANF